MRRVLGSEWKRFSVYRFIGFCAFIGLSVYRLLTREPLRCRARRRRRRRRRPRPSRPRRRRSRRLSPNNLPDDGEGGVGDIIEVIDAIHGLQGIVGYSTVLLGMPGALQGLGRSGSQE